MDEKMLMWLEVADEMAAIYASLPDDWEKAIRIAGSLCAFMCISAEESAPGSGRPQLQRIIKFLGGVADNIEEAAAVVSGKERLN